MFLISSKTGYFTINKIYSCFSAKSLINKLPQGGVLEELIIVENVHHEYSVDWGSHPDLFGAQNEYV